MEARTKCAQSNTWVICSRTNTHLRVATLEGRSTLLHNFLWSHTVDRLRLSKGACRDGMRKRFFVSVAICLDATAKRVEHSTRLQRWERPSCGRRRRCSPATSSTGTGAMPPARRPLARGRSDRHGRPPVWPDHGDIPGQHRSPPGGQMAVEIGRTEIAGKIILNGGWIHSRRGWRRYGVASMPEFDIRSCAN